MLTESPYPLTTSSIPPVQCKYVTNRVSLTAFGKTCRTRDTNLFNWLPPNPATSAQERKNVARSVHWSFQICASMEL